MDRYDISTQTKVLIVDDSSTVRHQVREALSDAAYSLLEARDGVEGFDAIDATPDLDVVICDLNMPRMNGLQLLAKLKEIGHTVPVVMLTTEGQPELIQEARANGALGWMVKPLDPAMLVKAVDKLAQRRREKTL